LLHACSTTPEPVKHQESASKSLSELTQDMTVTRGQVEKTLASLNALVRASPNTMRDIYDTYARDVHEIKKDANKVLKEADELRQRRDAWFAAWQKSHDQLQSDELRTVSEQRRAQVSARFDTVNNSLEAARRAIVPFVARVDEIRTVVGNDLTPRGLEAVSSTTVVANANTDGQTTARTMDNTIAELQSLDQALAGAVQ